MGGSWGISGGVIRDIVGMGGSWGQWEDIGDTAGDWQSSHMPPLLSLSLVLLVSLWCPHLPVSMSLCLSLCLCVLSHIPTLL